MIVFDLECRSAGHRFEGWFSSSQDFTRQQERGLVTCPQCGSDEVSKAVMAPNVGRKGNQAANSPPSAGPPPGDSSPGDSPQSVARGPLPPEAVKVMKQLASMQKMALKDSRWVGENFAEDARAMHYGERDVENIHGQATADEARELVEEGIEIAPLPFPVAPPGKAN